MAVKIYSDVTNKFYNDEASAHAAEEKLKKAQDAETARRKEMASLVDAKRKACEDARKVYNDAREEYHSALNDFCKEYGSYHYTMTDKNIADFFDFWLW